MATRYAWTNHPSANDTNAGTLAAPYKTLVKLASMAAAGDMLIVGPGRYTDINIIFAANGTAGNPITLWFDQGGLICSGYGEKIVVYSGTSYVINAWAGNARNYITLDGTRHADGDYAYLYGVTAIISSGDHWKIKNVEMFSPSNYAVYAALCDEVTNVIAVGAGGGMSLGLFNNATMLNVITMALGAGNALQVAISGAGPATYDMRHLTISNIANNAGYYCLGITNGAGTLNMRNCLLHTGGVAGNVSKPGADTLNLRNCSRLYGLTIPAANTDVNPQYHEFSIAKFYLHSILKSRTAGISDPVDAGDNNYSSANDILGRERPVGASVDPGAVELLLSGSIIPGGTGGGLLVHPGYHGGMR